MSKEIPECNGRLSIVLVSYVVPNYLRVSSIKLCYNANTTQHNATLEKA